MAISHVRNKDMLETTKTRQADQPWDQMPSTDADLTQAPQGLVVTQELIISSQYVQERLDQQGCTEGLFADHHSLWK